MSIWILQDGVMENNLIDPHLAQLDRANGFYPLGQEFESLSGD